MDDGSTSAAGSVASNLYRPSALPSILAPRTDPRRASETTLSSFAVSDTLAFAQDRVFLTLGARHQNVQVDSYNTSTGARTPMRTMRPWAAAANGCRPRAGRA